MKTTASTAAIDTLHLTMRDIRNFIIGLRPELLGGTTLLVDVAALGPVHAKIGWATPRQIGSKITS